MTSTSVKIQEDDECHSAVEVSYDDHPMELPEAPPDIEQNRDTIDASTATSDPALELQESLRDEQQVREERRPLSWLEIRNLIFSAFAWACTIANVTLVVGTSNVVLLSIGGDSNLSSLPLATFFLGASLVSFTVTPWHFQRFGRKVGFLIGVAIGLLGTALGVIAVAMSLPPLLIAATIFFGAAMGIGFYLRFAVIEVVPNHWADKAATLVVSGGCVAAFVGPESAAGTTGKFGDEEHLNYMGVFVMTGVFNACNFLFTSLVKFPQQSASTKEPTTHSERSEVSSLPTKLHDKEENIQASRLSQMLGILKSQNFIVPVLISACSWIIMALPMSVLRVAMRDVLFSSRQSLLTIELHFLGMYAPAFFTGNWIAWLGPRVVAIIGVVVFAIACAMLQFAEEAENADGKFESNLILWIVGMILIGVGWNCAFSASTVGSTRSYSSRPDRKSFVQAANDGLTFLLAGAVISTASEIYEAGGEELPGWRLVNWVVSGFIGILCLILATDAWLERQLLHSSTQGPPAVLWSKSSSQ